MSSFLNLTKTSVNWSIALWLLALCSVYFVANATGQFLFPDEITALNIHQNLGIIKGTYYYWIQFIGRIWAIGWLMFQTAVIDLFGVSVWVGVVIARLVNHLLLIFALYFAISMFPTRAPRAIKLALAALVFTGACAGSDINNVTQTFLLDHTIYFNTVALYALLVGLIFHGYINGFRKKTRFWLLVIFILYLNSHEINLVIGGILMATIFGIMIMRKLGNFDKFFLTDETDQDYDAKYSTFIFILVAIYVISAVLQIFSPSVEYRNTVWPPKIPLFPDAFISGLTVLKNSLVHVFQFKGLYFFGLMICAAIVAWVYPITYVLRTRTYFASILLLIFLLLLQIYLIASLDAYVGVHVLAVATETIGLRFIGYHQIMFTHILYGLTFGWAGLVLGALLSKIRVPHGRMITVWVVFITMGYFHTSSHSFSEVRNLLANDKALSFIKFDRQLMDPDQNRVAFVDELKLYKPDTTRSYVQVFESLTRLYNLKDIVYVPCELGPKPTLCSGRGKTPETLQHRLKGRSLQGNLSNLHKATSRVEGFNIEIRETPEPGEHYLVRKHRKNSGQTAIRVRVEIPRATSKHFMLYLVSPDGSTFQGFNLDAQTLGPRGEFKAFSRDARIVKAGNKRIVSVVFVVFGPSKQFDIRFQFADDNWKTGYYGNPDRSVTISNVQLDLTGS